MRIRTHERWFLPGFCFFLALSCALELHGQEWIASVSVQAGSVRGEINPFIYGQQLEVMANCVDGGIWAELLKNRRFDLPDDNGDGVSDPWLGVGAQEGAQFFLEDQEPFSGKYSQKIVLRGESEQPRGLKQTGQRILANRPYRGTLFLKGKDFRGTV